MAQGKYNKLLNKKSRKGMKGYPIATIAFYGPSNSIATKTVCGIIYEEDGNAEKMKKWYSKGDVRKSEIILGEVLQFIEDNQAKSVAMADRVIGCPHEEGIDYPEGESCPDCIYWKGRDRFTHEILH